MLPTKIGYARHELDLVFPSALRGATGRLEFVLR
jgi:hypothetical protein